MAKKRNTATEADVQAFMTAVFPGAPALAALAFDEGHVLRSATVSIIELRSALETLALEFQREVKTPLGFHPAFVQAKRILREHGRELPPRTDQ